MTMRVNETGRYNPVSAVNYAGPIRRLDIVPDFVDPIVLDE
jgi:hypothetical protein